MKRQPNPEAIKDIERFSQHLPVKADRTLVILKGHLLIEELLREFIDTKLRTPKALLSANRLEFDQCIALAHALADEHTDEALWQALRKLNGIRNKLAHNLEPQGIEDKVRDFVAFVNSNYPTKAPKERISRVMDELSWAITGTFIALSVALRLKPTSLLDTLLEQPNHSMHSDGAASGPAGDAGR